MFLFFCGRALSAKKIVLKKGNCSKWRAGSIRARHFRTAIFLLSGGQSTTRLIPSFTKLNYLTIDVLWSMMVLIFIVFGLDEVDDCFSWRTLEISFWPLFANFRKKWLKLAFSSVISRQPECQSF